MIDQHRNRDLHRGEAEPLIGDLQDVAFQLVVGQHEDLPLPGVLFEDPLPHVRDWRAPLHVDAEDVHRVVFPVLEEQAAIHQHCALLIGVVDDDADDW